ncbi:MAG: hypothetical protein JWM53_5974, partial [bacterium]|nr:hypothetical protein [bacterium]
SPRWCASPRALAYSPMTAPRRRRRCYDRRVHDDDRLPDVRDGLTRLERTILHVLAETERERGGANVATAMLYGRVVERIDVSEAEFVAVLQRLIGVRPTSGG